MDNLNMLLGVKKAFNSVYVISNTYLILKNSI